MPRLEKVKYRNGKEKRRWKRDITDRVKRFSADEVDDVNQTISNCVNQVESKLKLCASYEKLLSAEPEQWSCNSDYENCEDKVDKEDPYVI